MTALYLYDDARARTFEPYALTRPLSELRAGTSLIRERWERALSCAAAGLVAAPHLADFEEPGAPAVEAGTVPAGSIVANSRCVVALAVADGRQASFGGVGRWRCGDRVAAVRTARALAVADLASGALALDEVAADGAAVDVAGRWLDAVWDLIGTLPAQLTEDLLVMHAGARRGDSEATRATLGDHAVTIEPGATVEPYVVLDATAGPIWICRRATVHAFTRIVGPCYVGRESTVAADRIATCSIGDVCRVHGEVSNTVFLAYANKSHDGFVGHSYLGRWVNLGAGTTTSNLKNTYGDATCWTPSGVRATGLRNLGTFFGDHAKTGIGLRLTTGTVIGAGANVYGSEMPPKVVPPFAWGDRPPYSTYRPDKFLEVAERVMARRQVALSERGRRHLLAAHAARWTT